ncbi:Dolichyl-diphosphooligosaccharide--protein glycosyltransferase subunit 2 [Coniochaeta hoffmannii]|uniref:Dolichyl-diphosphooligosaccharide--protein glycosyltransferase subunit 2 n=1 Tax=Coniochaeta hoffmannii TaxID=91930 RepID=A0AA38VLL4_9PEZI|nr:Dolichyl-diphosphooligosaccharide--protein glycosyltransferase subunit 2 [Coniochaeta hoffmannii]
MHFSKSFLSAALLLAAGIADAASAWSFDEGTVSVVSKQGGDGLKEKLNAKKPLSKPLTFGSSDTIKIALTAKDNGKGKRPHQAFVVLKDVDSGLEAPFPLTTKDTGKAVGQISQKDIPVQLLLATKPLQASVVIASFGSAQGLNTHLFDLAVQLDPNAPAPAYEKPVRYSKQPEIHHIFKADPKSPPRIISLVFALAVLATVPALFLGWFSLGANIDHLSTAFGKAPLSHTAFLGSIVAMEFVFFLYYSTWNLFQVLPVIAIVGAVTVLSGTKALGEVQARRLAGQR